MKIVILAGGTGTRFWPMSRGDSPKQLCRLVSEKTMLEETLDRFKDWPKEKKFISTTEALVGKIKEVLPDFPGDHYIVEPSLRDTAPAMGFVAAYLETIDPDEPMAFIPADHQIGQVDKFLRSIAEAEKMIIETGKLLDISVHPTSPTTTLGYTKVGKLVREAGGVEFFEFLGHKEKPDHETAKKYLKEGNYLWHANYYMWTPRKFMEAYQKYAPEMHAILMKIQKLFADDKNEKEIEKLYAAMEKISIDYAITEKMDPSELLIIRGEFDWDDIGAWDTLYQNMLAISDDNNNVIVGGKHVNIDTSGSLIYGPEGKMITTIGIDDLVIVDTKDALLVSTKSRAQDVKKIVEKLKKKDKKFL
jgi:mannose-1-phosphate guanylyltransferase